MNSAAIMMMSTNGCRNTLVRQQQRGLLSLAPKSTSTPTRSTTNNNNNNSKKKNNFLNSSIRRYQQQFQSRQMSSYVLDGILGRRGGGGSTWQWPITKPNTIFNIVPQGHRYVVERFGKLESIEDSGFFLAIPFVDKIAYIIDIRERAMDIPPQSAITRDNVSVEVSGNLFVRFNDAEKAAYGAFNPLYSVTQHSQSAMRSAIGEMELDEILHGRARLNSLIKGSLQEAAIPWGLEIRRYEITEITPDQQIRIAMDKQAAAERDRREQVLRAEGDKRRAELISEGNLIRIRNEADGAKTKILLEAQGHADAIRLTAEAQARALRVISEELNKHGGQEAARLALARDYVNMYGEMGKQSNTILFNERPADVNALLTQAVTAMQVATNNVPTHNNTSGNYNNNNEHNNNDSSSSRNNKTSNTSVSSSPTSSHMIDVPDISSTLSTEEGGGSNNK